MCTSTIELNAERNQQVGGAFNSSIAFMLLVPTLLVVGLGVRLYCVLHNEPSLPRPE